MTASTTLLADTGSMIANTLNANSQANAVNPANPLIDMSGSLSLLRSKVQEVKILAALIQGNLDAGDPSKTTMTNFLLSLV